MSTEHKHTPLPGQKSLDNKDVYIKELPIVLISKIMSEIYKKIKDKSVAITPQALISASELWNIDDAEITPEITTKLIDKTLDIISRAIEDRFEKELNQSKSDITTEEEEKKGSDYLEEKTQNKNLEKQTILARCTKNSAFAQNLKEHATENPALVKNIMVLFCQYLEEVSKQNFDTFKHHLFTFPPEVSADINCLNGTSRDLNNSITLMHSSDGQRDFLNAHIVSTSMIVEQLKYLVHPDYEKHIPNFVQYACGLMPEKAINKIDGYYISPLSDIPAEIMWDILRSYQTNFTQIINADIADKINVMKGKIFQTRKEYPNINSLVVDAANMNNTTTKNAANHTIRNINKVIDPFEVNGLIDTIDTNDETYQFKWKEEEEIEKIIRKYYLEQSPSMILLNEAQSKINVGKSQYKTQRDELAKFSNFFKPGVIDHITPLIESENISDKVFALDALWVMADEFKGSSPVYFVQLLETLTQSKQNVLAYFNEMRNSIPKEHAFKLQKIIDRYELYTAKANEEEKDQSLYEQYKTNPKDADLKTIIQLGVPAIIITERIENHEDEIKQLDENSALKLLFHPQRNLVLDCLKETKPLYLKNEFLQKFLVEAARYNLEEEFLNCLDKFITDNNKEAVLSRLTNIQITAEDEMWTTALHQAVKKNNINIINAILSKEVDINISDSSDSTALMIAAENGNLNAVNALITAGADVNKTDNDGTTALMYAAAYGHLNVVETLIKAQADVNKTNQDGWTAMMPAAQNGHLKVVKALINAGADAHRTTKDGFTALMIAAQNGKLNVVKTLMAVTEDVNQTNKDGVTAMMLAAKNGHWNVVETLIQAKADVNQTNKDGITAMMLAAQNGHLKVVKTLIKAKADANKTNKDGYTALMFAAQNGRLNVVKPLIDAGADVNQTHKEEGGWTALMLAAYNGHLNVVDTLLKAKADVNKTNQGGWTAMMIAAQKGHDSVVKTLIKAKADVNKTNNEGRTAMMIAAQEGHWNIVETLIQAKADVNKTNNEGRTVMMIAAQKGHWNVVKTLIDKGADVNQTINNEGWTALMLAAQNGRLNVVKTLIDAKANVNKANNDGTTALMLAAAYGHKEVVNALIFLGKADLNQTNKDGWTAMMTAAAHGRLHVIRALIALAHDAVVDLNQTTNTDGVTALMLAAQNGRLNVVNFLIALKVDVNKTNNDSTTALMLAAYNGHEDVVKTLIDAGADVNKINKYGCTALIFAANNNKLNIVKALFAVPGLNYESKNNTTPDPRIKTYIRKAIQDINDLKINLKKHIPKNLQDIIDAGVKYIDNNPYPTFGPKEDKEREFNELMSNSTLYKDNVFITLLRKAKDSAKESKTMEVKQKETQVENYSKEEELKSSANLSQNIPSTRYITFNLTLQKWSSMAPKHDTNSSAKSTWPSCYRNKNEPKTQRGGFLFCY